MKNKNKLLKEFLSVGVIIVFAISLMGVASAKSLYVNKDINAQSPISAYDIQPASSYLVWQQTSSPTRYGGAGLAIDTDSEILFVTFEGSGTLDIVDAKTLALLGQVTAPGAIDLAGIVVDQDNQKVYAVNRHKNNLYVYSWDATNKILTNDITSAPYYISLSGVNRAHGLAIDEVNDLLYVGDLTTSVKIFNTADWSSARNFSVSQDVMGVAVDVENGFVYTGNAYPGFGSLGLLSKYDLNTNTESTVDIKIFNNNITDNVVGLAVDPATSLLYITTGNQGSGGSDKIKVFDSNLNYLHATGDIGNPTGIAIPGKDISYNPLNLDKDDGLSGGCVSDGDTISYTISYTNGNPTSVTGVTITDTLSTWVNFAGPTTWDIGTLAPSESGSRTLTVTVNSLAVPGGQIDNAVTINANEAGTGPTTQHEFTDVCSNRPPTANADGPYTGDEGSVIMLDASGSSDPDSDPLTYAWDLDDDGFYDDATGAIISHTWNDNYGGTVSVEVSDGQLTDTASTTVTVSNVAPTVNAGSDQTVNEGELVTINPTFADVGSADTHTTLVNWGDGTTPDSSTTHIYADNGVYTVTVTVTDDDGGVGSDTLTATVNNVAPEITDFTVTPSLVAVDETVTSDVTFTDPGSADTHTTTVDWGDETVDTSTTHEYTDAGVYTVTATVTDDDSGSDTETFTYVVVYDPNDGFVTGGGWINSPAGSYAADINLEGTANFGFVSKYKKGQSTPTGSTEFQYQIGDLNFHSNNYEWLVVASSHKAMYKGTGTINGAGNYGFMISVIDEKPTNAFDIDMFRIKIWDKDNSDAIVYDNNIGGVLDSDPTTEIAGGQIVIHKKK